MAVSAHPWARDGDCSSGAHRQATGPAWPYKEWPYKDQCRPPESGSVRRSPYACPNVERPLQGVEFGDADVAEGSSRAVRLATRKQAPRGAELRVDGRPRSCGYSPWGRCSMSPQMSARSISTEQSGAPR